ncbi:MAG: hypothetical protein R3C15_13045 [Thermoleophilia bacterium]
MRKAIAGLTLVAALGFGLAACGGDDDTSDIAPAVTNDVGEGIDQATNALDEAVDSVTDAIDDALDDETTP